MILFSYRIQKGNEKSEKFEIRSKYGGKNEYN